MNFVVGDYVTRKSYNNDTIFVIYEIKDKLYLLKGVDIRLYADSPVEDLEKCEYENRDADIFGRLDLDINSERGEYFYLPAKILHIDTDISLSNNLLNPYKIRKKAKIEKYINH